MEVWKIIFLFKLVIYRFHVNLPGCDGEKDDGEWRCCVAWLFGLYVLIMFEQKGLSVPFGGGTRESWHLSFILGLSKRLSSENLMAIARLANARDAWLIFL